MADTIQARLTNKAPGPRGVWASGELVDVPAGGSKVLTFDDEDELNAIDRDTFTVEAGADFDTTPPKRLYLALADSEDGANFRLIDLGKATHVGVAEAEDAPFLPASFRWGPINEPKGFEADDAYAEEQLNEPSPLDQSVEKLTTYLEGVSDPDAIEKLIEAETAGKSRASALAALGARRDALLA